MGLFSSRMTAEELAKAKGQSQTANTLISLATEAEGLGVTAARRRKAQAELVDAVGERGAAEWREAAIRKAGGKPKGLGKLFG